jgi:hypothetical protein
MKDFANIIAAAILGVCLVVAASSFGATGNVGVPGVALYPQSVTTFTQGGGVTATTSAASATIPATDFDTENYIVVTPSLGNVTLTLPASTTFPGIPNVGDTRTILIENAASAATTTTIAAGTGVDLQEPDGQNVVIGQNNYAWLTATRLSNTDIVVVVDEVIPAD